MNRNLFLHHLGDVSVPLDLVLQVQNCVPDIARLDASVVLRGDKFNFAVPVHDNKEDIKYCHLLNVIIEKPEYIVESIGFCVRDIRHQRAQITAQSVLPVTQGPVFVDAIRALH